MDASSVQESGYWADLGSQNIEKSSSWRTMNNLSMNLRRYAKPTDGGARGEVAQRTHAKRDYNDSGDLEDANHYVRQAAQKNTRMMMLEAERERSAAARLAAARPAAAAAAREAAKPATVRSG
jgi:hypothetical protein